jgi:type IV fimbrial biogenesis protein FimT
MRFLRGLAYFLLCQGELSEGQVLNTRESLRASSGYSFIELSVVIALLGIITAVAVPSMLTYIEAEKIRGAARDIVAMMNEARQLAVTRNTPFSVEGQTAPANQLRFCAGSVSPCPPAAVWVAPSTNANGWMVIDNVNLVLAQPVTFTALGAAAPGGRLRVQQQRAVNCLDVVVSASGRIQIVTAQACP